MIFAGARQAVEYWLARRAFYTSCCLPSQAGWGRGLVWCDQRLPNYDYNKLSFLNNSQQEQALLASPRLYCEILPVHCQEKPDNQHHQTMWHCPGLPAYLGNFTSSGLPSLRIFRQTCNTENKLKICQGTEKSARFLYEWPCQSAPQLQQSFLSMCSLSQSNPPGLSCLLLLIRSLAYSRTVK